MIKDVEHFFRCFSAIWYSSVENSLFSSVPHILIGLLVSLESNFLSSLYILNISPLSDVELVKIFSQGSSPLSLLLGLMSRSLIDLDLSFVQGDKYETICIPLQISR